MASPLYIAWFSSGVLLHLLIFSRNEWDRRSPWIFSFFCSLFAGSLLTLSLGYKHYYVEAFLETIALECVLLGGLLSSMMVYRVLLHPLRSFPGPIGARITAFWFTKESIPDLKFYVKLRRYHDYYGDFVRIRKNEAALRMLSC